jgi:hypothetical protein
LKILPFGFQTVPCRSPRPELSPWEPVTLQKVISLADGIFLGRRRRQEGAIFGSSSTNIPFYFSSIEETELSLHGRIYTVVHRW